MRRVMLSGLCAGALLWSGCLFNMDQAGETPTAPDAGSDVGSDGGTSDPCEGVACGGAGSCVEDDGASGGYVCECDDGYIGAECDECDVGHERIGGECVFLEALCFEVTCAPGLVCDGSSGQAECVCPDGEPTGPGGSCRGVSPCDDPDERPCGANQACVDEEGGGFVCVTPWDTCEGLRGSAQGAETFEEGEHVLYYERDPNQPWLAYCHEDPQSGAFLEYLTLRNETEFDNLFEEHSYDSQTRYDKIRIDPFTLIVNTRDDTYAETTALRGSVFDPDRGLQLIYFGTAGSCGRRPGANQDAPGRGRVNLVGTPFHVADEFLTGGVCGEGSAEFSDSAQVVDLDAIGRCGFIAPSHFALRRGDTCPDASIARLPDPTLGDGEPLQLGYDASLLAPGPPR